jgi:2,3-bisphosphoglycerate-dependent phosphoglycerate mutase
MRMPKLIIVRHGQSQWNLENRFTGEVDVPLTPTGRQEAAEAGNKLKGYVFTEAFTSELSRAQETLQIILDIIGESSISVVKDAALNERNYGQLQGLNKEETAKKFGRQQVEIWRRSYEIAPPGGESLKDTAQRVIPYFERSIRPMLVAGNDILVVAHGNSLRALMMHLENIPPEKISAINIPTGVPRLYQYDAELKIQEVEYI